MSAPAPLSVLTDLSLAQLRDAGDLAVTVACAAEAGVFTGLRERPATAAELAERLRLDPRAVRIVLPVLAEMRLLEEEEGRYSLSERGRAELGDPASPRFAGHGLALWLANLRRWSRLDGVLRTGVPPAPEGEASESVAAYMAGMVAAPTERVRRTVAAAVVRVPGARTALDVGGGPGVYARELLRAGVETTVFDTPEVVAYVGEHYGLAAEPGIHLAAGDFLVDPLPPGPFDVALLSNVLHLFSPAVGRALLAKVAGVLAPGGVVAVAGTLRGRSPRAARMGVMMLLRTEAGDVYTEDELRAWLEEAGLEEVRAEDVDVDRQLVTARRP
jgi:ubiquinone/menaquinone biosynthesis C-methylase UbiE